MSEARETRRKERERASARCSVREELSEREGDEVVVHDRPSERRWSERSRGSSGYRGWVTGEEVQGFGLREREKNVEAGCGKWVS